MSLNLPDGVRKQAFMTVVRELRNDPVLSREVATWRVWDGSHDVASPTVQQMPCVGLRMTGGGVERWGGDGVTVTLKTTPSIIIEVWTAGTDQGDLMNLYDSIDNALYPMDAVARNATQARFHAVGIDDWQPTKEVLPENTSSFTAESIQGVGSYQLTLVLTQ